MEMENKKQDGTSEEDSGGVCRTEGAWRARIIIIIIAAPLAAAAAYLLLTPPQTLPAWNKRVLGYPALTLFFAAAVGFPALALARIALHRTRRRIMRGVKRLAMSAFSIVLCIVAFDLVCSLFPALQTSFVKQEILFFDTSLNDPKYGFRGVPNQSITIPIGGCFGDLMPKGGLPPSAAQHGRPEGAASEKQFTGTMRSDGNAFPNSAIPSQADVVIVGDSFAYEMLMSEGKHWVTAIRENVKGGTYNIANPGWSPTPEYLALEEYGFPMKPKVVIWAFYEGNDLFDSEVFQTFYQRPDKSVTWAEYQAARLGYPPQRFPYNRPFVRLLLGLAEMLNPPPAGAAGGGEGAGPVVINVKNDSPPVALDPGVFYQMLKSESDLRGYRGWQICEFIMNGAIDMCRARGITFVLVFFPAKSSACFPFIEQQIDHEEFYNSIAPTLPENCRAGAGRFFEELRKNDSSVANLLNKLCESRQDKNVIFVNLTGPMRKAVGDGIMPYWAYDTHLNIEGHRIAAETILARLRRENILPPAESP